jgi:integrase
MSRRSDGEGSVQELPDGTWEGKLSLGSEIAYDGAGTARRRRVRRHVRGRSRAEVVEKLRRIREANVPGAAGMTLQRFLDGWLERKRLEIRPTTLRHYESVCRIHLIPAIGTRKLEQLTTEDAQRCVTRALRRGVSPRQAHHVRAVLRTALNDARRRGLIGRNSAEFIVTPRVEARPVEAATPERAQRILEAFSGHRLEPLILLALHTGARQGELLGLRWSDCLLEAPTPVIRVDHQLQRVNRQPALTELKTRRSLRILPLTAAALEALHQRRRQQREEELAAQKWQGNPLGLVFTTTVGTPMTGTEVTKTFRRRLGVAGVVCASTICATLAPRSW